jgi:hypothetical protein
MKIHLRDLELARQDPAAYLNKIERPKTGFGKRSKGSVFLQAIYEFHKPQNSLAGALEYLTKSFEQFKNNPASLQIYQDRLITYAHEFEKLGNTMIKPKDNLTLSLPNEFRGIAKVYGQISRIDLAPEGYHVWLFERVTRDWRDEIRFPLIQSAYTQSLLQNMFAYDDEVKVGVYDFSTSSYTLFRYTEQEIEEAEKILFGLLRQLIAIESQRRSEEP